MDAFRRTRYAVTLLILLMALFVSAETAFIQNVKATPAITLAPNTGPVDTTVQVNGSGFSTSPADTSCTITSSSSNIIGSPTCTISAGTLVASGFTIAVGSKPGTYTVTVTGNAGGAGDFAQEAFTITSPTITLSPGSQRIGGEVLVNGTGFSLEDGSCSISSPTNPSVITVSGCTVTKTPTVTEGSFIVGNVPTGEYTIEVTGCPGNIPCSPSNGDFAQAVLEVLGGPQLFLIPSTAPVGQHVSIEGGFYSASDTTCSISSPSLGSVVLNAGCAISPGPGSMKNVTGSFVVGNVAEGQYVIQVTGNTGDFAQAVFNVTAGAFIQLGVNGIFVQKGQVVSGPHGAHIDIEGSQFLPNDALNSATCSVSSPSNGNAVANGGCSFFKTPGGFVNVTGSFVVGNVPEGQYVITVSGSAGDSAQAVLNVTAGAFIQLGVNGIFLPTGQMQSGPIGTHVAIEGSQFLANDAFNSATCSVSSPSNGNAVANGGCSFFKTPTGFVNVTGSFVVGNVAEGQYVITVSGSAGDSAQAVFNVTAGAFIQLGVNGIFSSVGKPASGPIGAHIDIEGSQFLANDAFNSATCSLGSPSNGAVILNGGCSFFKSTTPPFNGYVNVTGSFVVGNVQEGQYVITVSGSAGDSAQAFLNVTAGAFIQLGVNGIFSSVGKPASGPIGTHVSIEGSQFLPGDAFNSATCSVSSPSNGNAAVNKGCSFFKTTSGFVNVTGSFVVGNVPEGQYVITVSGSAGDSAQAILNVTAGAFIQLGVNGIFASVGQAASGPTGTHVSIEGSQFLANDAFNSATCSVSSPTNGAAVIGNACSFFKTTSGYVNVTGSFTVGNVAEGQYVITVSGSAGDSAQAVFNVTAGAFIQLGVNGIFASVGQIASGPIGTHVGIEGSQFLPNDVFGSGTCSVSSPSNGAIVVNGACAFFKTTTGLVNVTGSFVVGNVPEGQYAIQVSGNAGDVARAVFNVTAGAFIQLGTATSGGFVSVGHTAKGPTGTTVSVEGSQFLPGDAFNSATCTLSSPTRSSMIQGGACSFFKTTTGLVNVTGSFIVGNVGAGQYVIQVSGSAGDSAQAIFNVTSGPFIQLIVGTIHYSVGQTASGPLGTSVGIEGSYFTGTATTCTISSPSGGFITGAGCSIFIPSSGGFVGFANVTGSFIVGNVLPGQYVVQVTDNTGSFAQAVFNVTLGAQIALSPAAVKEPGFFVNATGTGFLPTDTACVVSSPGSNAVEGGSGACSIRAGTGIVTASFLVGNVLPGEYVIQVTGSQGDFAQAVLTVRTGPILTLSPGSGSIGSTIQVNGTSFLATDQSCSISSTSTPNPILLGSAGCSIAVGTGNVTGSFVIGPVNPGEYVIEVTGCVGNNGCAPSAGDFAQRVVNVTNSGHTLTLSPSSAVEEATVTFVGSGLNPSDTACSVQSFNGAVTVPDTTLISSSTCSIVSPGLVQGSFVVSPYATTDIPWLVRVTGTPVNDFTPTEPFTVTPDLIVTPTSGTINSVFTFTGSGFSSAATSCTAVTIPAIGAPSCSIDGSTGQVSGSVVVPSTAGAGTYGFMVTDSAGNFATGEFTVGTPSALVVLNPASVDQGQAVGVAGTGFNPQDAFCVITAGTTTPPWVGTGGVAPTCAISSGYASGSFVVSDTAPGGYYLITIQACTVAVAPGGTCPAGDGLDFASNFLGVTLATTVVTYSSTTTSSTSTTSMSTTTTSVATSFSISSTTFSTTGILFTTYTHFTYTTVSGQTSTTETVTSSTTQTQTTVTVSTTSSFTTVPCGPLPCGFAVKPTMNPASGIDSTGLLAALLLLIPMLIRRLFS